MANKEYKMLYIDLKQSVEKLFQSMDDATIRLWRDDLQHTLECVCLEESDELIDRENCGGSYDDVPDYVDGTIVVSIMDDIKNNHLNKTI